MGVLPLVLHEGTSWQTLGLKGDEKVSIRGIADLKPRQVASAEIISADGSKQEVPVLVRIDTLDELEYFRHGGILHYVLRSLVGQKQAA
jgi:aconitate hydratase